MDEKHLKIFNIFSRLIIFYFVMFSFYLLKTSSFLMRDRKGLERRWGRIGRSRGKRNYTV